MAKGDDYEVGYKKPPKGTQWQKTQSGNPSGKRKTAPSMADDLAAELRRKVRVTIDGKTKFLTTQQVIARKAAAAAAKGDLKTLKWIVDTLSRLAASNDNQGSPHDLSADDQEIFSALVADVEKGLREADGPE